MHTAVDVILLYGVRKRYFRIYHKKKTTLEEGTCVVSTKHMCIQRTNMSIFIYNGLQCWSLPCTVTYSSGQLWKKRRRQCGVDVQ